MQNNKYYYVPQSTANDLQIENIQISAGCNIIATVPIKIGISPIKNQQGENLFLYAPYNEIEWDFSTEIHNQLLAIEGTQFFDTAEDARNFKENGLL
jgi:hypothetical protein